MKKFLKKLFIFVIIIPICLGFVSCNKSNNNNTNNTTPIEQNNGQHGDNTGETGDNTGETGDNTGNTGDNTGNTGDNNGEQGTENTVTEITLADFVSQTEGYIFNPTNNFSVDIQLGDVKNYNEKIIYSEEETDTGKVYTILASLSEGQKEVALMREYLVVYNDSDTKTLSGAIVDVDANKYHYTDTFYREDKDELNYFSTYNYYKIMQIAICPYNLTYLFDGSFFQYIQDVYKLELNKNNVTVSKETTGKTEKFTITCIISETKVTEYTITFNDKSLSEFNIVDINNGETDSYKVTTVEENDEINFPSLDLMDAQTTPNMQ